MTPPADAGIAPLVRDDADMPDPSDSAPPAEVPGEPVGDLNAEPRSLLDDVRALIDDGKTYLEAEVGFQKTRVAFVADRANSRTQVFDLTGKLLEVWRQFGRPSGLYIDAKDVMYSADSESNTPRNPGFKRGIRIGSVKDGRIRAFIPYTNQEQMNAGGTHGVEGVTADAAGNVYGAFVAEATLVKYVKN